MASESSSTTILSLPVELQQDIISRTDKRNVLAVRLACCELFAAADDHFLVTFYSERKHLMTRHGVQALINITEDARLCSKLTSIELVAVEIDKTINPAYEWPYMSLGTPPPDSDPEEVILQRKDEERRREAFKSLVWENWTAERDALLGEGHTVSLLSKAFQNLSARGREISLQISRNTNGPLVAFGCRQLKAHLTGSPTTKGSTVPYLDRCQSLDTPLTLALQAVTRAELPLSGLCIGDGVFDIDDRARGTFAPFLRTSASNVWPQICAQNLSFLKLNLDWHLWVEGGKEGLAHFAKFLQAATGLETVEMDFDFHAEVSVEDRYLSAIGNAFSKSKLQRVLIRELSCYTHELRTSTSTQEMLK